MLPECLIGNCNRRFVLFDGEPVDGNMLLLCETKQQQTVLW